LVPDPKKSRSPRPGRRSIGNNQMINAPHFGSFLSHDQCEPGLATRQHGHGRGEVLCHSIHLDQ
jgi:hypothetical protein